ncbi:MAG: hypothetical protein NZ523_01870 [Elioraea sp.]|nr:hypothetical protein [Elioraea sp.]
MLAGDVIRLLCIFADPAGHGIDIAGNLAGYFARVAEVLRREDEEPSVTKVRMIRGARELFGAQAAQSLDRPPIADHRRRS